MLEKFAQYYLTTKILLNKKISKDNTKTLFYRYYKKFEENKFAKDLRHELQKIKNPSYSQFEKAFVTVLDNHVPLKTEQLRFNLSPRMTKALQKAYDSLDKYKKQRNCCVKTKQD